MTAAIDPAVFGAAQAGDPGALDQLLRALEPDIRRYARRQCHRTSAVGDVVQEAMIVLYRRIGNVRNPLGLAGWILTMVTRLRMLPVLGVLRGAEELTARHEAEHLAHVPPDDLRIEFVTRPMSLALLLVVLAVLIVPRVMRRRARLALPPSE